MVVERLLSYWEDNFSGAMFNFGRVTSYDCFSWIFHHPQLLGKKRKTDCVYSKVICVFIGFAKCFTLKLVGKTHISCDAKKPKVGDPNGCGPYIGLIIKGPPSQGFSQHFPL